jgi:hypothetical protein
MEEFYILLELNGEETKQNNDVGAFRDLDEILVDGTFGGEEIFMAYTELYDELI